MTTFDMTPPNPDNATAASVSSLFGSRLTSVGWTSPPLEIRVDTVPGFDWNAELTACAELLIAELFDEAEPDEFTFDDTDADADDDTDTDDDDDDDDHDAGAEIAGEPTDLTIDEPGDGEQDTPVIDTDDPPCYFAQLPGTVRWVNDGIWIGVTFRPGEDWRPKLRQYAIDEVRDWTCETEEHDVDFRLHMDYRFSGETKTVPASMARGNETAEQ